MTADDFHDLYKLLRGSKSAFAVLDARTLFLEKKIEASLLRVTEAHEAYKQSRSRLMKHTAEEQVDPKAEDADRQLKRIQRKQDKVREVLKKFDELLPPLEKLAAREKQRSEKSESQQGDQETLRDVDTLTDVSLHDTRAGDFDTDDSAADVLERPARVEDVEDEFIRKFKQLDGDEHLSLVCQHFGFRAVEDEDDIYPNAVYFIHIQDESFLVHTKNAQEMGESVPLVTWSVISP